MKELFKKVNIPEFDIIQKEVLDSITEDYNSNKTFAFNYDIFETAKRCPKFMSWFLPRNKAPVRLIRFYVTKPYGYLNPHIDGGLPYTSPFGLNIPILNCENTKMFWFEYDSEEEYPTKPDGYYVAIFPRNPDRLRKIGELEITKPYFVRNDIMHSVENYNNGPRIMLTVRWPLHSTKYRTLEEVMKLDDLFDSV